MRSNIYQLLKEPQEQLVAFLARQENLLVPIICPVLVGMLLVITLGKAQAATPVVNAPATQNVERETYLVFNATNSNLISITDGDNHNQTVTITVTNGSFFLEDVTGLASASFTGTGQQKISAGAPVTFSGSLTNVNAALSESSFYPTDGYAGPASVTIATEDTNGDTTTKTINVTVLAGTDTDGDGVYDHKDLDDDNDGIPDNVENPCEKTFAFDLSSEGWFTVNNQSHTRNYNGIWTATNERHINSGSNLVPPASHSTDPITGNDGCPIDNTGRANKNIAGASPTRTNYIVDADPSGGIMYVRSPNLGGIDYSDLLGGTFQYDAYNYRVNRTGNPNWIGSSRATVYIFDTQGRYVRAQSNLTQNPHFDRFEAGLWNTFAFTLNSTIWTGDAPIADVLADVDQISIRMEYIGGGNTGNCADVEYYAMDNVVLTAQASCDDDIDNDGIPNYLDLYNNITNTYDADEAGHGQPHTNGVVNGPVGTDGIPDAVQGPGNGNSGGAQYPPILDLDGDDNSGATNANYQATFTEDGGAIAIADTDATLYDGNDTDNLASLTVVLTNRPDGTAETLSVNGSLLGGITAGAYNPANGTLTLSGNASVANYLDALKKIVYNNSSQSPDGTATRSVTVVVNDGKADSNTGTTTLTIVPVNDAPVNTLPAAQSVDEEATLTLSGTNAISVNDDAGTDPVKVTLSVPNGTINIPADPDNIVTDNGTALVELTGTITQINAALDGLEYTGDAAL